MKKGNIEALGLWSNSQKGIKTSPAAEPTPTSPALSSKQRNYLKWVAKGGGK